MTPKPRHLFWEAKYCDNCKQVKNHGCLNCANEALRSELAKEKAARWPDCDCDGLKKELATARELLSMASPSAFGIREFDVRLKSFLATSTEPGKK